LDSNRDVLMGNRSIRWPFFLYSAYAPNELSSFLCFRKFISFFRKQAIAAWSTLQASDFTWT